MNQRHEKNLRSLIGVTDSDAVISDEVKSRVEQMEDRMARFFGRYMEMNAESLALLVSDLADDQVFISPKSDSQPEIPLRDRIGSMKRGELEVELRKLNFDPNPSRGRYSENALRELLEKELEKVAEPVEEPVE